jgi:hypothetical protein
MNRYGLDDGFFLLEVSREIGRHLRAGFDADEAMVIAWQRYPHLDESHMTLAQDHAVQRIVIPECYL